MQTINEDVRGPDEDENTDRPYPPCCEIGYTGPCGYDSDEEED